MTASPVARRSSVPVTTSPVLTPIRACDAELGQRVAHLDRRAAGPQRVVLVHLGDAEDGHDRIADELLHRPAVRLDDPLHPLEVAGEQGPQRLGVGRLAERGRAGHVAEEDGDRLALLARGRSGLEQCAAVRAAWKALRSVLAAVRADRHQPRLVPAGTDYNR